MELYVQKQMQNVSGDYYFEFTSSTWSGLLEVEEC